MIESQPECETDSQICGPDFGLPLLEVSPAALISATLQPSVNAALWQNHVPLLTELSLHVRTAAAAGDITIDLTCDPPVIWPRSWHLQAVGAGQVRIFDDLDVTLDGAMLASLTEGTRATATFTARIRGVEAPIAERRCDLRVLASNEWGGSVGIPDILAAFVEPNDPAVATLLRKASDHLRAVGKKDSLEGYQAENKARIWSQVEAVWHAVGSLDIRYVNPAPSFERVGQRIRPPSQILMDKLATCLDLAVVFAAAIEAIGLRPVIVLKRDHAFAGFWLTSHDFGSSVADDAPSLRTRLALHDLILFETTLICGQERAGFRRACEVGEAHIAPDKDDEFDAIIDVHRARQRRIRPLSSAGQYTRVVDAGANTATLSSIPNDDPPPLRDDPAAQVDPTPTTPEGRLERWRKRLLDLSARNRLLNLQVGGKQALAVDCPDPTRLESMLADMRGRTKPRLIRFRPWPDLMTGKDPRSAKIHNQRLQEDASRKFATEALEQRELIVGRDEETLQATLTEIYRNARAAQQEGGTNTLFLTIGSLLWRQKDKDRIYRAPILLVPVVLERPSVRSGFSLRAHDDETKLNATLLEMLRQEFDIRLPTLEVDLLPTDDTGLDVERILSTFRAKLRDVPGWEVTDDVALANLSFAKYLMWKDLTDRVTFLRESEVVRRLMDGSTAESSAEGRAADEIIETRHSGGTLDDVAADLVCPLEADSSQLQAVASARAKKSFVMIGPPGTGKSQTIANIIADTLSQGRTVLFVAEKRAALEVVQRRMRNTGLGDFCLDLFSAKTSKAMVLEQLGRAQQTREEFDPSEWKTSSADIAALRTELNGYVRELHRKGRNGWTPFRAMGCVLRAEGGGIPEISLAWPAADVHDAGDYQRLVELVEDAAAVLTRVGDITAAAALAGVEATDWSPPWQANLLDASRTVALRLRSLSRAAEGARNVLGISQPNNSRQAIDSLTSLAALLLSPVASAAAWACREGADEAIKAVLAEGARVARYWQVHGELAGRWKPQATSLPLADLETEWAASEGRWFAARAIARRAVRRRLAEVASGPLPTDILAELARLIELQALERAVGDAGRRLSPVLGRLWNGLETDFERVEAHIEWARRLRAAAASCVQDTAALLSLRDRLRQLVGEGADLLIPEASVGTAMVRLCSAWNDLAAPCDAVARLCGSDPVVIVDASRPDWADTLSVHLESWTLAARHLRDWCAWRGVLQRATALGIRNVLNAVETGLVAPSEASRVFEANYARWWIGLAIDGTARLRGFVAAQHEKQIERFRALDERLLQLAGRLTRARLAGGIPGKSQRERNPEYVVLARELAKRQKHLPVRQLAERMPNAFRQLTPCLMMSPLSVAQYLPPDAAHFDLVIFDEASQIPTWDAIGVIGRGRQVIVVGDPKQLPPTRFFERQAPGADQDIEIGVEDLESILDECIGGGIPSFELKWHYRSRHESLIAFSNHTYYGGSLVTFPSPVTEDKAVTFRHVPGGVYGRAGARTNQAEARALTSEVLALLRGMLAGERKRSVGIVTFNAEQQSLIDNLLDDARREDPRLEPFFSEDASSEPVLVKNLESVQGEERDVMMFSLTYGPDQGGRISMNFGPLNQSGGERRLNVAITRAREALIVFGSLTAEHIDLSRTSAIGVMHLKRFLEFATHGSRAFAMAATGPLGDHESPFEAAVAERLGAKGWILHPQIGVSGFRIDLGVVDPDAPGAFLAGIECDGATYHRGATARDRDRLRQIVLEGLGWRILRLWSTDWWTNAARECNRLDAALRTLWAEKRADATASGQGTPSNSPDTTE